MTTPNYSIGPKRMRLILVLVLMATSLFGYMLPKSLELSENQLVDKENILTLSHPLTGLSDNTVICGNDGSEVHEIYLCGTSDQRLLNTNISNLKQIVWAKLQPASCTASQPNCPNTSPTCTWDQLSTDTQYIVTQGGEYRVFVQYNDNSTERFYFNVYANGLNPNPVVTNIDCGSPGSITINNVPSSYEFSINSGATWQDSNVFSITNVNTYNVQLRRKNDTGGCLFEVNGIDVGNNSIDATATIIPISCNTAKGEIQVDISQASSTYVYEISQGGNLINSSGPLTSSTYTFTDLDAGTYDINVTLASVSNCTWTATQTLPAFDATPPNVVVTKNIDCTNGIITITHAGGTAPYEYSINGSSTFNAFTSGSQSTISISTAGSYTIRVRDANDCEIDAAQVNVITEPEIEYTVASKDITCNGNDDGTISVDVTNTQGYSITYSNDGGSNFQTSNVFSNLSSGTYSIVIKKEKSGSSCDIAHGDITINPSVPFVLSASVTQQISCSNGSATISSNVTSGGTAPFEYSTNGVNFQTANDFTGLGPGDYTITARDANGCIATVIQTINAGSNPSDLTFVSSGVDCTTGATDVQVAVQGGQSPFDYRITAPSIINAPDDTFTGLAPNTYTFEVTANDGCIIVRNFTVPEPNSTQITASVKNNVSCFTPGTADGVVDITVNNFDTSYSITIEDGTGTPTGVHDANNLTSSTYSITGLWADTFTIYVSDASSACPKPVTVTVAAPPSALVVDSHSVTHMNCGTPGSVTIEASGGWGNYTYTVEQPDNTFVPFQSSKTITGLTQAGIHTINVRDVNDCLVDTTTFDLEDRGGPISVVDQSASIYCYSSATLGELKIDVADNGAAPYFYVVNNGTPMPVSGGTFTLSNLTPANYEVKVIGNNGCETIVADTQISGQLFAFANITKPLGCGTPPDAVIEVTPENGYPPYTYEVDSGSGYVAATMPFSTNAEGSYIFKITDAKGCEFYIGDPNVAAGTVNGTEQPVEVTRSPDIVPTSTSQPTACGKAGTGSITLGASGGTPPFEYAFSAAPFDPVSNAPVFSNQTLYNNLDATSYYYQVRDALGCVSVEQIEVIGAESAITADIEKTDISCDPVAGGNVWGNMKVANIQNSTGPVTISLIRVQDPVAYAAGNETRTWTYRRYENIDLATNSNYNNASNPSRYGTTTGFDIRLYWALDFVVRIEDDRGCFWESSIYNITSPPIPSIVNSDPVDQTCANGATYDFSINNVDSDGDGTPDLVGPFDVRLYPYQLVDADGDGVEDDVTNGWRPFNDISNPAWDGVAGTAGNPNERDYRFTNGTAFGYDKLLFGVAYSVAIRDNATGCIRWRALRPVVQPPAGFITVDAVPQSETCRNAADGEVEFTINNYAPGVVNYKIYNAGNPAHAAFQYNGTATGTGAPLTINVQNMRRAWYVVEVEDSSGCQAGERFLIYTPRTVLNIEEDQVIQPTCHTGGQVAVTATGGWDDERYFNIRNKLRQNWHPYEYALVLDSQTPVDTDFQSDNIWTNVVPTAYDGVNNVYRAYIRDGGGCLRAIPNPITFTETPRPVIDNVAVTNRCTSTNEIYDVVATLSNQGTNPVNGAPVYIWDGEVTSTSTRQLGPGNHTLEVRDENGCSVSENIFIYPQMVTSARITQLEPCSPPNSGEITIDVYGGSLDYTFERMDNGETNNTGLFTGLTHSTPYDFRITDNNSGCPVQTVTGITIDAPVQPNFMVESIEHVTCNGADDGKIVVSQTPATDNLDVTYDYSLDGVTYQASNVFENLAPGIYTDISVRSSKNCIQVLTTTTINEPTQLVLETPTVSPFTCTADNGLGMATITASINDGGGTPTGTAPYNYSFNGSSFSTTASFDIAYLTTVQTLTIDVIDGNGCTDQTTATIPAATKVTATIVETQPMDCDDDAIFNVMGADGTGIPNYETRELPSGNLINGTGNGTITIPAGNPGTYVYELTDTATGCTAQVTYNVAPFDTIEVTATKLKDVNCFGDNDGGLEFTITNYTGPYVYDIYNVNAPTVSILNGSSNTSMGPVSISTLGADTYFVIVDATNAPKCDAESNHITIQSPSSALDYTFEITQSLSCTPGSDAQITATAIGGWNGYEFELIDSANPGTPIQTFDSNNVFDGLTSGINYELTLRDSGGCNNVTKVITIPLIDSIIASESSTNPSCPGEKNGTITVNASREFGNGHTNFQYILNNINDGVSSVPQTSNVFNDLIEGQYSVTVTDGRGCDFTTGTIDLIDPSEVVVDAAITQEPSCTPNQGEITLSAFGGSGTFEYSMISPTPGPWTANNIFDNLGPGTYEFLARDANPANLCPSPISVIRTINVIDPLEVTVDNSNTIINCFGEMDAVIVAEATGGLGGYTYELQDGSGTVLVPAQGSGIFENLGAGTYRVRALSGIDCEDISTNVNIIEPPLLQANLSDKHDVQCFGETDGTATITVTGGVAPYSYILSSEPQKTVSTNFFENLDVGNYTVIVQDANGCDVEVPLEINGPTEALTMSVTRVDDELCSSDDNGLIELQITGGTGPYEYSLQNSSGPYTAVADPNSFILDNLDGGAYLIYIRDVNGCSENIVQEVMIGADLTATYETAYECRDGQPFNRTTITMQDQSVATEVMYVLDSEDINSAQNSSVFENIAPGTHYISILHSGGCIERLDNIVIDAPVPLVLTQENGDINEILVKAEGGDGGYTYYFNDIANSEGSYYINRTDTYVVRVVDRAGCETSISVDMEFIDIEIPNFFTPDGDGIRDTWSITNWEAFPDMYVSIFDRYGRKIKQYIGQGEWDGTYLKADLPTGDYWYIIKLNGANDDREFVGHMTVYR